MADPRPLGNGRYRLVTDAPRDPVTGKRVQKTKTITAATLTEARHAQQAFEVEHRGHDHTGTAATFSSLLDRFLDHVKPNLVYGTWSSHERMSRLYLKPALGDIPLSSLTTSHFDALYHDLLTTPGRRGRPLSPGTIGKVHDTASSALDQAIRWEWIVRNPAALATKPKNRREDPYVPEPSDVAKMLRWLRANKPDVATFIDVVAALGCRPGELCAVRWCDVDFELQAIHIVGSIDRTPIKYGGQSARKETKTGRRRRVAIGEPTVRVLEKHRAATGATNPDGYVFSDAVDGSVPWRQANLSAAMPRWRAAAGVEHVTLRSLRHFVATQLIGAGVDVRTVAGRLGHANPALTLNVYSSFIPANDRAAAELLAAIRGEE